MKNIFEVKRFRLLLVKTLFERPMQLFGLTALIIVFTLLLYALCKSLIGFNAAQNLTFMWGLIGGGSFLASFMFSYFSSNASGSSYLTLPASHFEKWLCGILIAGVLFPIIFLISYRIIDTIFVSVYHAGLDPLSSSFKAKYDAVYIFAFDGIIAGKVYPMFLFLSGCMFTGSLYFNKVGFIKVALSCCLFCFVIYGLNWAIAKILFGTIEETFPFSHLTIPVGKESGSLELPESVHTIFLNLVCYIIPAVLWLLAYVRLREKEF